MENVPLMAPVAPNSEERTFAMAAHLAAFAGHLFPFAHIIAPIVVWMMKRDASAFVNDQGKESVNAQITLTIYMVICIPFCFLLIGFLMLFVVWLAGVILVIMAAMAAYEGRAYRYPMILRLVK